MAADTTTPPVDARAGAPGLVRRLAAAMAAAGDVVKSSVNTEQNYRYASAEAILRAVRGQLLDAGIVLIQRPQDFIETEIRSRSGTAGTRVTAVIDFTFTDGEEDFTVAGWRGEGQDYGDKAYSKAYTNAVKTFVRAQWLLPTDDDGQNMPDRAPSGGQGAPAWATAASDDETAAAAAALERLLSHSATAREYLDKLAQRTGGAIPGVVALWLSHINDWVTAGGDRSEQEARDDELARSATAEPTPDPGAVVTPEPEFEQSTLGDSGPEPAPPDPDDDIPF